MKALSITGAIGVIILMISDCLMVTVSPGIISGSTYTGISSEVFPVVICVNDLSNFDLDMSTVGICEKCSSVFLFTVLHLLLLLLRLFRILPVLQLFHCMLLRIRLLLHLLFFCYMVPSFQAILLIPFVIHIIQHHY